MRVRVVAFICVGIAIAGALAAGQYQGRTRVAPTTLSLSSNVIRVPEVSFPVMGSGPSVSSISVDPVVRSFKPPLTAKLFRIEGTLATDESKGAMGDKLGIGAQRNYGKVGFSDGIRVVDFPRDDDVNCFAFMVPGRMDASEFASPEAVFAIQLPSLEEARASADAYLAKLGLEPQIEYEKSFVNQTFKVHQPDGTTKTKDVSIAITYACRVQGEKLEGAGGKVTVTVGDGGEVVGLVHFAESTAQAEDVMLRDVAAGLEDLKEGKGLPPSSDQEDAFTTMAVRDVHLAYYAAPVGFAEEYYKPVFVFDVEGKNGVTGKWIVSALKDPESFQ